MSIINTSASYRRDDRSEFRVPVVVPVATVTVDSHGSLEITLDSEPYSSDCELHREDLHRVLDEICAELGTPIRVEVHEQDGTTYADFATPPRSDPADDESKVRAIGTVSSFIGEIAGEGFVPNERVAVAVVVAHQVAGPDGTARLRLPPALLASHSREVVLLGATSGTLIGGGAE